MKNLAVHTTIKDFIATGMTEQQAEKIVTDIITIAKDEVSSLGKEQSNLATKDDLKIAISELKETMATKDDLITLKTDITEMKRTFATKADITIAVGGLERDMKWVMGLCIGIVGLLVKVVFFN